MSVRFRVGNRWARFRHVAPPRPAEERVEGEVKKLMKKEVRGDNDAKVRGSYSQDYDTPRAVRLSPNRRNAYQLASCREVAHLILAFSICFQAYRQYKLCAHELCIDHISGMLEINEYVRRMLGDFSKAFITLDYAFHFIKKVE
jgi:hypothetical protein